MAGWGTWWPAAEYPRNTHEQFDDINDAMLERADVIAGYVPYTWKYRSPRDNLMHFKQYLKWMIYYGGVSGQHFCAKPPGETNYNTYFDTHTGVNARPPIYTLDILKTLKIPTNYFDYTPYRDISGLGFIPDATLPYNAGYQNADTAAGGTDFPAGRTYWTTMDYGIDNMKTIINALVWISFARQYPPEELYGVTAQGSNYLERTGWATAKAAAEADYPQPAFSVDGYAYNWTTGRKLNATDYAAQIRLQTWKAAGWTFWMVGGYHYDTDFYAYADLHGNFGDYDEYDIYGNTPLRDGKHTYFDTQAWTGADPVWSKVMGDITLPLPGTWVTQPAVTGQTFIRGCNIVSKFTISKFDVTGGFQFRE